MSKKIAIGLVNCYDQDTYTACKESLPDVDMILDVHHTSYKIKDIPQDRDIKRYMSYGGLHNMLLRSFNQSGADYIFLMKSNLIIKDSSIFQDYINTAKVFGTYFMSRGTSTISSSTIEDEVYKLNLCLYSELRSDFIFMVKGHIKSCGYMYEGYTNIDGSDDTNVLEVCDFYHRLKNKINYLPEGYFPDVDYSLLKIRENTAACEISRPCLIKDTTNNRAAAYGKFYHMHNFVPGKHNKTSKERALDILEKTQQVYAAPGGDK